MLILYFIVKTIIDIYVMMLLLRSWLQWFNIERYNPFSHSLFKKTEPVLKLFRYIIPYKTTAIIMALLLTTLKYPLMIFFLSGKIYFLSINIFFIGMISLLKSAGYLVIWVLIIRSMISWIHPYYHPLYNILWQLTEPIIAPIRNIIPPIGGIDFSPMLIIIILNIFNYLGNFILPEIWNSLIF
ncbi:MAG: YggT family protein [Candidatus Dasytiphilus stammeri]